MNFASRPRARTSIGALVCALTLSATRALAAAAPADFQIPVEYHKLANGLKVVLSRDTTAPTAVVAVYYNIGFRIEPKDRTGFAHLFEHLMFQGSKNLGKMEFIRLVQKNGGVLNGSTRFDFTNYFEVVPRPHARDRAVGRGRPHEGPRHHAGQPDEPAGRGEERGQGQRAQPALRRVPVDRHAAGRQHELVQRAQLLRRPRRPRRRHARRTSRAFFKTYYAPNNAVLVVVGRHRPGADAGVDREVLRADPARRRCRRRPDISEPRQEKEKRVVKDDPLATRPALAVGVPHAEAQDARVLRDGPDRPDPASRARTAGCTRPSSSRAASPARSRAASTAGSATCSTSTGPTLWTCSLFHDTDKTADADPEGARRRDRDAARRRRSTRRRSTARWSRCGRASTTRWRSSSASASADLLASFALFDDDPAKINRLEAEFRKVTPELIQKTAQEYLRPAQPHRSWSSSRRPRPPRRAGRREKP